LPDWFLYFVSILSKSWVFMLSPALFIFFIFKDYLAFIIWMALIAYWGIKDKVYLWQCVIGQLVVIGAPILQLFRLVDRHLWDLAYSTIIYKTLMPFINIGTVIVCYLPLIMLFAPPQK